MCCHILRYPLDGGSCSPSGMRMFGKILRCWMYEQPPGTSAGLSRVSSIGSAKTFPQLGEAGRGGPGPGSTTVELAETRKLRKEVAYQGRTIEKEATPFSSRKPATTGCDGTVRDA